MTLIRLDHVTKCYQSGSECEILPLQDAVLEVRENERVILLGKSGSGKTTLLNILGGVDTPTSGRMFLNGRDMSRASSSELAAYRRRDVGFIFQSFNLFSTLTVGENVLLPLELLGWPDAKQAREHLDAVGLAETWKKFPEQLSGGEQQRVAIARALVKEPSLILADEPTGNLDLETGNEILQLLHTVCRTRSATLVMATHSRDALWIAQRHYRLRLGRLVDVTEHALANPPGDASPRQ